MSKTMKPSWDDFKDEVAKGSVPALKGCKVGDLLRGLDQEARESVEAAIANGRNTTTALHKGMLSRGADLGATTLSRHRSKTCVCYRKASK